MKSQDKQTRSQGQWLRYVVLHPVDGFAELRWKQGGSVWYLLAVLAAWLLGEILCDRWYGRQFYFPESDTFRLLPYLAQTVVVFAAWTISNWAVCTLLDGKGTMRNIGIYSAYALVPYVVQLYVRVLLSQVLVRDEAVFLVLAEGIGCCWTVVLLFSAIRAVHRYAAARTVLAVVLTLLTMLVLLVLLVVLTALFEQMVVFFSAIGTELLYRWRLG